MPAPVWLFRKVAVGELEGVDVIGVVDARKEDAGEVVDWNELLVLVDDCDCDTSNDERVLEGVLEGILSNLIIWCTARQAFESLTCLMSRGSWQQARPSLILRLTWPHQHLLRLQLT